MKPLIIRKAGGVWWIIRRHQDREYHAPVTVNETAARIMELLQEGKSSREIAELLAEGDETLIDGILQDILDIRDEICAKTGLEEEFPRG